MKDGAPVNEREALSNGGAAIKTQEGQIQLLQEPFQNVQRGRPLAEYQRPAAFRLRSQQSKPLSSSSYDCLHSVVGPRNSLASTPRYNHSHEPHNEPHHNCLQPVDRETLIPSPQTYATFVTGDIFRHAYNYQIHAYANASYSHTPYDQRHVPAA